MKEKLKVILSNAAILITVFVFIILVLLMFETVGFRESPDEDFWTRLGITMFLQLLMIAVWIPEGKKQGANDNVFKGNKAALETKITAAGKPENYDDLDNWCKHATEENRKAAIKCKLAKVGLPYHVWEKNKLDAEWRNKQSKRAIRRMKWLDNNTVKVKEIKATELISNSTIKLVYDVANKEGVATGLQIGAKVVVSLLMSIVVAMVMFQGKPFTLSALADFGFWMMTICSTMFFALRAGKQLVTVVRQDFIVRNITFLDNFDSWLIAQGKPTVTQQPASEPAVVTEKGDTYGR